MRLGLACCEFMVHRFLRVEGRPPWAALRHAQLWMLAADRVIPEDMPRPDRKPPDHLPATYAAVAGADLSDPAYRGMLRHCGV